MKAHETGHLTHHRQAILAFALRLTKDAAMAEDITQETYIRVQRTTKPYRGEAQVRSWLCSIALNLIRDHYRSTQRALKISTELELLENIGSTADDAETVILKKEMSDCIVEHLLRLPHPQSDVVALHDMADLSHAEIAMHLEITVENSRVILHRGRCALREVLQENCVLSVGCDAIACERPPPKSRV